MCLCCLGFPVLLTAVEGTLTRSHLTLAFNAPRNLPEVEKVTFFEKPPGETASLSGIEALPQENWIRSIVNVEALQQAYGSNLDRRQTGLPVLLDDNLWQGLELLDDIERINSSLQAGTLQQEMFALRIDRKKVEILALPELESMVSNDWDFALPRPVLPSLLNETTILPGSNDINTFPVSASSSDLTSESQVGEQVTGLYDVLPIDTAM